MKNLFVYALGVVCLSSCERPQGRMCVARGTRILTPTGWRYVETLKYGDAIVSVCESTLKRSVSRLISIAHSVREVTTLRTEMGEIKTTPDHPLFDPETKTYVAAENWATGHRARLLRVDVSAPIVSVPIHPNESRVETADVFDLTVESHHQNFVANGVLVHNKSIAPSCIAADGTEHHMGERCELDTCVSASYRCIGDVTTDAPNAQPGRPVATCICNDKPTAKQTMKEPNSNASNSAPSTSPVRDSNNTGGDIDKASVMKGEWKITRVEDTTVPDESTLKLSYDGGVTMSIFGGCNTMVVKPLFSPTSFKFMNPSVSSEACSGAALELESKLFATVARTDLLQISNDTATFSDQMFKVLFVAKKLP